MLRRHLWPLPLILLLALAHSGLYASFMPPWGLLDEEQHFHYVQSLVERRSIPLVGTTMLSTEIVDSVFEARRWERFMWPAPPGRDPQQMGLEGHSYEGYQPPLYYTLMAPVYAVWPGSVLSRLYALRWASVVLSLLTLVFVFYTAQLLFGKGSPLPYYAALLLAVIPERVAAGARVSNDVALEVSAAGLLLVCTWICLRGITWRSALLLGLGLGLTLLAKVSGALLILPVILTLWSARRAPRIAWRVLLTGGSAALILAPWVLRNISIYGDLTGSRGFDQIANLPLPSFTLPNLVGASLDLFRNFWFVWWKGATVTGNILTVTANLGLAALLTWSAIGLARYLGQRRRANTDAPQSYVLLIFVTATASYAVIILLGYFGSNLPLLGGRVLIPVVAPVIQGRYFLPVIGPIAILFVLGLQGHRLRARLVVATAAGLLMLSLASLFGNLLPYHYYWSTLASRQISAASLSTVDRWRLFTVELVSDKPAAVRTLLAPLLILLVGASCAAFASIRRAMPRLQG